MNASLSFYLFYFAAVASSGYFFYLGRRLPLLRRIMASLHGLIAAISLPLIIFLYFRDPQADPDPLVALMLLLAALSIGSMIYSMFALRGDWRVHLLHVATLVVLMVSLVMGALLLLGT